MTDHNASETSLFEQCGYSREAIWARLERNWYEMFEGPDKIYWENDEGWTPATTTCAPRA